MIFSGARRYNAGNAELVLQGDRKFLGCETPDGDFGPATEKAVRSFQAKAALEPDGEIGAETWAALVIE